MRGIVLHCHAIWRFVSRLVWEIVAQTTWCESQKIKNHQYSMHNERDFISSHFQLGCVSEMINCKQSPSLSLIGDTEYAQFFSVVENILLVVWYLIEKFAQKAFYQLNLKNIGLY